MTTTHDANSTNKISETPRKRAPESHATGVRFFAAGMAAGAMAALGPAVFLDEAACRSWVIHILHPDGARCPACGLALDYDAGFRAGRRVHCGRCGQWFTARTGTFIQGSQLSYSELFLLALLIECKVSTKVAARTIGISADTVRFWIKKFKALETHG